MTAILSDRFEPLDGFCSTKRESAAEPLTLRRFPSASFRLRCSDLPGRERIAA